MRNYILTALFIFILFAGKAQISSFPAFIPKQDLFISSEDLMNNYLAIIYSDYNVANTNKNLMYFQQQQKLFQPDIHSGYYSQNTMYQVTLPAYTQGFFCDFEDHINRKRKLRIDFSVK